MILSDLTKVGARSLPARAVELLRPGETWEGPNAASHRFPSQFFAVPSWEAAKQTLLAPHFKLSELMVVDCREADQLLHEFPHYIPCAAVLLATTLEIFRREVDAPVFVSTNGGYRSPAHRRGIGVHAWGTAADIYRIGQSWLNDEESITKYGEIARRASPLIRTKPFAAGDDHLHLDLGFLTVNPEE